MTEKIVILGAGFLGVNAALDLAGEGKEVVIIDKNMSHQYIPGTIDLIRNRFSREELEINIEEFMPAEIQTKEAEIIDIKPDQKTIETVHGLISYDRLVIGLGGQPANYGMDISALQHVWGIEPAQKLAKKAESAESALIIGGGYVGIEVAGEIAEKGIDTTIIDAATRPLSYLDEESSEKILEILQQKQIKFKGGKRASEINENTVEFEQGGKMDADLIIWAGGVQASETVQNIFSTGCKGIEVNQGLSMVGNEDIFAGGDCADIDGQKTAHKAMDQGQIIAENISITEGPLKQTESEQAFLLVSIGDTAGLVFKNKLIFTSKILRYFKDLVKTYYFTRLNIKKKLINATFLP